MLYPMASTGGARNFITAPNPVPHPERSDRRATCLSHKKCQTVRQPGFDHRRARRSRILHEFSPPVGHASLSLPRPFTGCQTCSKRALPALDLSPVARRPKVRPEGRRILHRHGGSGDWIGWRGSNPSTRSAGRERFFRRPIYVYPPLRVGARTCRRVRYFR